MQKLSKNDNTNQFAVYSKFNLVAGKLELKKILTQMNEITK